jgi:hypothetical protein
VPPATIRAATKCAHFGTRLRPNSSTPRKGGFQEEGHQAFISQQRRDDIGGRVGESAPVGAELERHHDAGDDTHAEGDREDLDPESGEPEIDLFPGDEMQALQHSDEGSEADGEGRQQDMPGNHPDELQARKQKGVEFHGKTPRARTWRRV